MYFPTAGIEVFPLAPCACAFAISLFCSMAGISGAFLLLPYQVSVLGYAQPGVSATNQIFNVLACPAGVWRYARQGRLLTPLAMFIAVGTLPGVFLGAILRVTVLAALPRFLLFVSLTLFYLCFRILSSPKQSAKAARGGCENISWSWSGFSFSLDGASYSVASAPLLLLSFCVGVIGGVYGIGGGAIMVPFLVSFFGLPIYAISGASLFATFLTSVAGVAFYSIISWLWQFPWAAPDWGLGCLLGLGGIFGMYCGASLQKHVPPGFLRLVLLLVIFCMAALYLLKGLNG